MNRAVDIKEHKYFLEFISITILTCQIRAKITKLDDFNLCKDPRKEDLTISLSS